MAEIVVMPKIGLTAREALLREWLVDEGDSIATGDVLFEIETDKIVSEVESPASGVLLRRIDPDVVVSVGEPIAVIGDPGEDVSGIALFTAEVTAAEMSAVTSVEASAEEPDAMPRSAGDANNVRLKASPVARKRARELGVDLATLAGSGPGGRITMKDIEELASARTAGPTLATPPVPRPEGGRREEPSRLRKAIAAAMSQSAAVPQFSLERDVDVTNLRSILVSRSLKLDSSLSLADAVGAATARAISTHEVFLRHWDQGSFRYADGVHLGLAVAVDDGLIVPVLRHADHLSVEAFSAARRDLQERTLAGKLGADESGGAVFTISNLGPFGVDRFRALVNPPESGILAVGRARSIEGRLIVTLDLSADHRVVDGVQGARLLGEITRLLEEPDGNRELLAAPSE
jgi:pyruvate dehydrogenase E2 component (dihydrolipoyllysine-residue acetyltransferase)